MNPALHAQLTERLKLPDAVATYEAAGAGRHTVLRHYDTPLEAIRLLLGLKVGHPEFHGRGADALLRAILHEYQTTSLDVWPSMLVVAFYPAMCSLTARLNAGSGDPDDVFGLVLESFLAAARLMPRLPERKLLPLALCSEMSHRAFAARRKIRKDRKLTHEAVTEALDRGRIEPFANGRSEKSRDPTEALVGREETRQVLTELGPAVLAVLTTHNPSLRKLTRAVRPDLTPPEQEALYQRLKRYYARSRRLGVEPEDLPPWWLSLGNTTKHEKRGKS